MAVTSGSTSFNLDLTELVEEAFERAGRELRSGYDLRTASRSLNKELLVELLLDARLGHVGRKVNLIG